MKQPFNKEAIFNYIKNRNNVSYGELMSEFEIDGNSALLGGENNYSCIGISKEFKDYMLELWDNDKITVELASLETYMLLYGHPILYNLPISKTINDYKKPHWGPTLINAK